MKPPQRFPRHTTFEIRPGHFLIARRVGGQEFWTVDEYCDGASKELTETKDGGFHWLTERHEAEALADAYQGMRSHNVVPDGAR